VNEDNLSNVRREASRHFRNKKREYLKHKINERESNSKIKNIRDLCKGITEFKEGHQCRTNLVKYERDDLLADPQKTLNSWKNNLSQLLNVQGVGGIRQTEIQAAEPFVPERSASEVEAAIEKLKRCKSPGVNQITADLIQGGGDEHCTLEIHKLTKLIWKKGELPHLWKESIVTHILRKGDKTD
jgi:hypothetical protein